MKKAKVLISFFIICMIVACTCTLPSMATFSPEDSDFLAYYELQPDGTWKYYESDGSTDKHIPDDSTSPYNITKSITQTSYLGMNTILEIHADVYSSTGESGSFVYQRVTNVRVNVDPPRAARLVPLSTPSISFGNGNKSCTITMLMQPTNTSGTPLGPAQNYSATFYCI